VIIVNVLGVAVIMLLAAVLFGWLARREIRKLHPDEDEDDR
jgi:hypothetical protein